MRYLFAMSLTNTQQCLLLLALTTLAHQCFSLTVACREHFPRNVIDCCGCDFLLAVVIGVKQITAFINQLAGSRYCVITSA